jgi:ferredoxin, 2Fe-2S
MEVKITIENLGRKQLEVTDTSKTALQHFQDNFVDWMHACGAKGRCTTCKFIVTIGETHLSVPSAAEAKYRREGLLNKNERLACQVMVQGDIHIMVPEEGKMPHIMYSE